MELFFKLYGNAIGNFLANHMCLGGVYLVGSLTASLAEKMKGRDLLAGYKVRHPVTYEFIK
jgi:glucokinase